MSSITMFSSEVFGRKTFPVLIKSRAILKTFSRQIDKLSEFFGGLSVIVADSPG